MCMQRAGSVQSTCARTPTFTLLIQMIFFPTRSIARTANVSRDELAQAAKTTTIELEHPKEWKLAKLLLKFPEVQDHI